MNTQWESLITWLQNRLQQPLPGYEAQRRMMSLHRPERLKAPDHARESGVLILLYPEADEIQTVLIERSKDGSVHSGQIALPGGKKEDTDTDIIHTALREANEEIRLSRNEVNIIGRLSPLYIPASNFEVNPVIGSCAHVPALLPSEDEVASILRYPLRYIFSHKKEVEVRPSGQPQLTIRTKAYLLSGNHFIWGATAMIFSELESLWDEWHSYHAP